MIPVVAAPKSPLLKLVASLSDPAADGKAGDPLTQATNQPGNFLSVLARLFAGKAPDGKPNPPDGSGDDPSQTPAASKAAKKGKDQGPKAAVTTAPSAESPITPLPPALGGLTPLPYVKDGASVAGVSPSDVTAALPATVNAKLDDLPRPGQTTLAASTAPVISDVATTTKESIETAAASLALAAQRAAVADRLPSAASLPEAFRANALVSTDVAAGTGPEQSAAAFAAKSITESLGGTSATGPKGKTDRELKDVSAGPLPQFVNSAASSGEPSKPAPQVAPADQIRQEIGSQLNQIRQLGRAQVQVDLHPPELGRVQVHLAMADGRMNVHMVVQDDNVRRLLDQQLEPLRVRFAEMGVSVGQFDVRRDGSSPQQNQQPASESSVQPLQPDSGGTRGLQKAYGQLANPHALVDVMA